MTRETRLRALEARAKSAPTSEPTPVGFRVPLAFVLVAGLRTNYDPVESIAANLALALDIFRPGDLRRSILDDLPRVMIAARVRLAEMMQERGAAVPDLPTDNNLRQHLDVLEEMFADLPDGVRKASPFACAADWFL